MIPRSKYNYAPIIFGLAFSALAGSMAGATPDRAHEDVWIAHRIDPAPEPPKYGGYNSLAPGDFIAISRQNRVSVMVGERVLYSAEPGTSNNLAAAMIVAPGE